MGYGLRPWHDPRAHENLVWGERSSDGISLMVGTSTGCTRGEGDAERGCRMQWLNDELLRDLAGTMSTHDMVKGG
jgi:hypothetical protein